MMAKPVITLELQYPMIQFLIITVICNICLTNFNEILTLIMIKVSNLNFEMKISDEKKQWFNLSTVIFQFLKI